MQNNSFDLAIVGAGPAGLATAVAASQRGLSVLVLEQNRLDSDKRVGEHLAPSAKEPLRELGIEHILDSISSPGVASCWSGEDLEFKDYMFHPLGLGLNVARPAFDCQLAQRAQSLGATVKDERRVTSIVKRLEHWILTTPQDEFKARFLVNAAGRNSQILKDSSGPYQYHDKLIAVTGIVKTKPDEHHHLMLEALESGWWYLAPLPNYLTVATWMTDADLWQNEKQETLAHWQSYLQQTKHIKNRIFKQPTEIFVTQARTRESKTFAGADWLAVGDAATSFDPLSSSGMEKGLRHGLAAAQAIYEHLDKAKDALDRYAGLVKTDFQQYLEKKTLFYSQVMGWPDSTFWARRRSHDDTPPTQEDNFWDDLIKKAEEHHCRTQMPS